MPLRLSKNAGDVYSKLTILRQHIGLSSVDLFEDIDQNGTADKVIGRLKQPGVQEGEWARLGGPDDLNAKILQWVWMVAKPPSSAEPCEVRLQVAQFSSAPAPTAAAPGAQLALDRTIATNFPVGGHHGTFDIFFLVVVV